MVNCIGGRPEPSAILVTAGAHPHDYGKAPRRGRKVGHITVVGKSEVEVDARLARVQPLVDAATDG
jgi:5-(carboxyamino)imidazole ribonucleotide synthase